MQLYFFLVQTPQTARTTPEQGKHSKYILPLSNVFVSGYVNVEWNDVIFLKVFYLSFFLPMSL